MNYCSIGKLVASFGFKGELLLLHHLGKKTSLKGLETIFIEANKNELLPYFLERTRIKSDTELYLKLEGIDAKETAQKLLQKQVWLPDNEFQNYSLVSSPISLLVFMIVQEGEELGEVLEIIEQPHQLL